MSVNVAFNVVQANGPRRFYSTETPDPSAGESDLAGVNGIIALSSDESQVTYSVIGWTRPPANYRFEIDGVPVEAHMDEISVSQPSPVTLPVLSNIGRKITTAGLNPSRDLSFSKAQLTGSWRVNGGEHSGVFQLPAQTLTKSAFGVLSVARSGSLAVGAVTDLKQQGESGKAGGFLRYAYQQTLFRGWAAHGVPFELRLHLVVDRVQVTGRVERPSNGRRSARCVSTGVPLDAQLQTQP